MQGQRAMTTARVIMTTARPDDLNAYASAASCNLRYTPWPRVHPMMTDAAIGAYARRQNTDNESEYHYLVELAPQCTDRPPSATRQHMNFHQCIFPPTSIRVSMINQPPCPPLPFLSLRPAIVGTRGQRSLTMACESCVPPPLTPARLRCDTRTLIQNTPTNQPPLNSVLLLLTPSAILRQTRSFRNSFSLPLVSCSPPARNSTQQTHGNQIQQYNPRGRELKSPLPPSRLLRRVRAPSPRYA